MTAARELARAGTVPDAVARRPAPLGPAAPVALARRLADRLGNEWLPLAVWSIGRTGRLGLVGIALLLSAALFLFSTHLRVAAEVAALRADLTAAPRQARPAAEAASDPSAALRALPARADVPALLRQLFGKAVQARLAVDTGKYELRAARSSGVVRYQIAFPVRGPYPQVRAFIDDTLATMPAVALSDLALERKSIGDGNVEAQIRMTVYTAAAGARSLPGAGAVASASAGQVPGAVEASAAPDRVATPTNATALFAQHSWYVPPPPRKAPPPPPPPPPPEPTAPAFPYTFLGSFSPGGEPPVYFLARGDRVIDARVGDRLDGVYRFESASDGQLVFVYLPLNTRHLLAAGAPR